MNLPNKITMFRVILIPFFVATMLYSNLFGSMTKWIALAIFVIAAASDALDGYIARKYNLVSNFGKLMDPLADKLLVCSALICLSVMGRLNPWVTLLIVFREFIISGVRQVAADEGVVIAASIWGKFKTIFQMLMVILLIADLGLQIPWVSYIENTLIIISVFLTLLSLVDYLVKNRQVFKFN